MSETKTETVYLYSKSFNNSLTNSVNDISDSVNLAIKKIDFMQRMYIRNTKKNNWKRSLKKGRK